MNNNYFLIFDLPIKFDIDLDDLERKYLNFQLEFHPDKLNPNQKNQIQNSITINEAYQTLQNPISRAEYILKLNQIAIDNEQLSSNQNFKLIKADQKTLENILLLQEQISELKDQDQVSKLAIKLESEIKTLIKEISNLLNNQKFQAAASLLIQVKYLQKSRSSLKKMI